MSRTSDLDNIDREIDDTKSSEFYLLFQNRLPRWNYWPWTLIVSSALLSGILFTAASRKREVAHTG